MTISHYIPFEDVVAGLAIYLASLDDNDGFSELTAALDGLRLNNYESKPEHSPKEDTTEPTVAQDRLPLDTDESDLVLSTSILSKDNNEANEYSQLASDGHNPVIVNDMLSSHFKSSEWEESVALTSPLEGEVSPKVVVAESSSSLSRLEHTDEHKTESPTIPIPDMDTQANKHSQLISDAPDSVAQPFLSSVYLQTYDKELEEILAIISLSGTNTQVNKHPQLAFDAPNSVAESLLSPVCLQLDDDELHAELSSIPESDVDT